MRNKKFEKCNFKTFESYIAHMKLNQYKSSKLLSAFKDGDIIKIAPIRPKNKKWLRKRNFTKGACYYRIVKKNTHYGYIIQEPFYDYIKEEDKNKLDVIINGYKPSDIYDLGYFVMNYFPDMIDKFLEKYKQYVSENDIHYNQTINILTKLKECIKKDKKDFDNLFTDIPESKSAKYYKEVEEQNSEVWKEFGRILRHLWI